MYEAHVMLHMMLRQLTGAQAHAVLMAEAKAEACGGAHPAEGAAEAEQAARARQDAVAGVRDAVGLRGVWKRAAHAYRATHWRTHKLSEKRARVHVALPLHPYNRGVWRNFAEVMFPDHALRAAAEQRRKAA